MSDKESSAGESEGACKQTHVADVPASKENQASDRPAPRPAGPITGVWVDEMSDKPDAQPTRNLEMVETMQDGERKFVPDAQPTPRNKEQLMNEFERAINGPQQPTPRTFELRCKDYDVSSPQALMEVIADILESHEELERAIAHKDAELAAAKSETCVHSVTDPTCLSCTKRNLEAERTAREQAEQHANGWLSACREAEDRAESLEQRLAAVEAALEGLLDACAAVDAANGSQITDPHAETQARAALAGKREGDGK